MRGGSDGTPGQDIFYEAAINAKVSLGTRFKERHGSSHSACHWKKVNIGENVENGNCAIEIRHVLMDYSDGNKQLKSKMMTRLEAWKRNETLAGTGFAWAQCGR